MATDFLSGYYRHTGERLHAGGRAPPKAGVLKLPLDSGLRQNNGIRNELWGIAPSEIK